MQHEQLVDAIFSRLGTTCSASGQTDDPAVIASENRRILDVVKRSFDLFPTLYESMSGDDLVDSFVGSLRRASVGRCFIPEHIARLFTRVV